ncbi:MAG TPA: hypothetical protein VER75_02960 [Thermoleophilaceae bacterium]|nr:hypothetical protein [Thermoleophilaceae bacterium]
MVCRPSISEMMSVLSPQFARAPHSKRHVAAELRERWAAAYGPLLARLLEPARHYSILKVGTAEFAYTRYDQFVQALAQAWALGLVPEARPSALGSALPDAAPGLRGVDSDLSGLDPADFALPVQLV